MDTPFNVQDFRFNMPIDIRWNDLDPIGHVNNVIYFDYFQNGRVQYMIDLSPNWDWTENSFVIAHLECDYYKELPMQAKKPKVWLRTSRIGNKSFDLEYLITSEENKKIVYHTFGKSVQVLFDLKNRKSLEIPLWLQQDIINFEPAMV